MRVASELSGFISTIVLLTVPMFLPWNSPNRELFTAMTGFSPLAIKLSICPPISTECGSQSVNSMDVSESSRIITERFEVSEPSRFMIVVKSPTEYAMPMTSTISPALSASSSESFLNLYTIFLMSRSASGHGTNVAWLSNLISY